MASSLALTTAAAKAAPVIDAAQSTGDWDLKAIIATAAILVSLGWNYYNLKATRKLQIALSNNQLKQKIFEKLIFDPICTILREYYNLIEEIEATFLASVPSRNDAIKSIIVDRFNPLRMKLERELAMADTCSMISRDDLCTTAIDYHDQIIQCFSTMRNDALTAEQILQGKEDAIIKIKELVSSVIEIQIQVSQKLVTGSIV